jgi:hypothetical protein
LARKGIKRRCIKSRWTKKTETGKVAQRGKSLSKGAKTEKEKGIATREIITGGN